MLFTILLVALAGGFKAVSDTLQHHFSTSVFSALNQKFWNPAESWKHAQRVPLTKYPLDAWHLSNSCMILCFITAAVPTWFNELVSMFVNGASWKSLANPNCSPQISGIWVFILASTAFIAAFNFLYDKVLRRKA